MTAPAQIQQDDALSPAQQLWTISAADMGAVDAIILERMHSPVGMIPDLAQHLVGAGGKRLRPLLTVATARLCGYKGEAHHKLAAAVEFIHSATLLHDDVVDESDLRRGKKPANLIWGNSASILVGDFLFARAFNLMVETGSMEALGILSNAASVIAEGEVQQLASLRNLAMSEADYMDVIKAKTAALFAAATEVSPVIAGLDDTRRAALRDYGLKLGLAFQLIDDALDYGGQQAALGKSVGDDFREGKMTLPVIRALAKATQQNAISGVKSWWIAIKMIWICNGPYQSCVNLARWMRPFKWRGASLSKRLRHWIYSKSRPYGTACKTWPPMWCRARPNPGALPT